jgi:hypothetical protein
VVGAEYVYCYGATGHIGYGSENTPVRKSRFQSRATVRQNQPAAFDLLRHGVKALDNALQAMANVTELIDDVDDADKRPDSDKYLDRRYRKANAYETLDHLLTTALDKSSLLRSRLDDYLNASPELAYWLKR